MTDKYILKGKKVIPCNDLLQWGKWFKTTDRRVALTEVGPLSVSTVFIGLDHRFIGKGPPIVFETMIFGEDPEHSSCDRYCTWEEAEEGHKRAVEVAKERLAKAEKLLEATCLKDQSGDTKP